MPQRVHSQHRIRKSLQIEELGEFGFIQRIKRKNPPPGPEVVLGIGDDAAVLRPSKDRLLLLTSDVLIEGVHFIKEYAAPEILGKKALAVNLSDIAAMGGTPVYFLLAIGIPSSTPLSFLDAFSRGLQQMARRFKCSLVGGDVVRSTSGLVICITVGGEVDKRRVLRRDGAKPGDQIFLTGPVGNSALGLRILQAGEDLGGKETRSLIKSHLSPVPRVREGSSLASAGLPTSMIDISDGLLQDLRHIVRESRVGARLCLDQIPLSKNFRKVAGRFSPAPWDLALSGGEDYELLFTVSPRRLRALDQWSKKNRTPVFPIGEITKRTGRVEVKDKEGHLYRPNQEGFEHFS